MSRKAASHGSLDKYLIETFINVIDAVKTQSRKRFVPLHSPEPSFPRKQVLDDAKQIVRLEEQPTSVINSHRAGFTGAKVR